MDQHDGLRLPPAGQRTAARQAAALFVLAGVLAFVGIPHSPGPASALVAIGVGDLAFAVLAWVVPWHRTGPDGPVLLALPAFVILAYSTWAFGGFAAGTGPFFVLVFAWLGLNFSARAIVALILPATAAYIVPLALTDQPPQVLASALVLLPIAVGIGLLTSRQVSAQRRDRATLAAIERWRAALTVTLAHDLRSPLTAVHLVLDALRADAATGVRPSGVGGPDAGSPGVGGSDGLTAEQRQSMIDNALRQIARLSRLSAVLLDADRVDSGGGLRLDLAEVAFGDVVAEVLDQLSAFDVQVEAAPDLVVSADRERLEQILFNLVGNALRHGAPPVRLRAEATGDVVRIEVRDHGPGLPAALGDRVFGRFVAGAADGESVGLGLWIARELARAHGGDVEYEPARPGARLVVTLPRRANPAAPDGDPPRASARGGGADAPETGTGRRRGRNSQVTQLSCALPLTNLNVRSCVW